MAHRHQWHLLSAFYQGRINLGLENRRGLSYGTAVRSVHLLVPALTTQPSCIFLMQAQKTILFSSTKVSNHLFSPIS
jgi:hypothetical protein